MWYDYGVIEGDWDLMIHWQEDSIVSEMRVQRVM